MRSAGPSAHAPLLATLQALLTDSPASLTRQELPIVLGRAGDGLGGVVHHDVETLVRADVTVAPVNTPLSVLDDPHVSSEGRTLPVQIGNVAGRLPPLPYETDAYQFSVRREAPAGVP